MNNGCACVFEMPDRFGCKVFVFCDKRSGSVHTCKVIACM